MKLLYGVATGAPPAIAPALAYNVRGQHINYIHTSHTYRSVPLLDVLAFSHTH